MQHNNKQSYKHLSEKKRQAGFSLIELVVTIALMGIVATFVISSYTDQMREQRHNVDTASLNQIDEQLRLLLTYDDIWREVSSHQNLLTGTSGQEDTLTLVFTGNKGTKNAEFITGDAIIRSNIGDVPIDEYLPLLQDGLIDSVGEKIKMESSDHLNGTYTVTIVFGGSKLSSVREFTINNENIRISNEQTWS